MSNPPSQAVPSLQQLGLLPSPEEALKSLQTGPSPGWNTAPYPRPPLPSPDMAFPSPFTAPQQQQAVLRIDQNAALAGLLHGTVPPQLIPNPSQFLLRNFGIDITGSRPRWVGLTHLRNYSPQAMATTAAQRGAYGPNAPLTQFLHTDFEHLRAVEAAAASMMNPPPITPAAAPRIQKPAPELKRKEYYMSAHHDQPPVKRQSHAQSHASHVPAADEIPSEWVPPSTGRDPFHERVGSIPLVDLRAQPMSYLQDFIAQVIRDTGKNSLPSVGLATAPAAAHTQSNSASTSAQSSAPAPPPPAPPAPTDALAAPSSFTASSNPPTASTAAPAAYSSSDGPKV